jgi:beta-glucanase (GH16 family)
VVGPPAVTPPPPPPPGDPAILPAPWGAPVYRDEFDTVAATTTGLDPAKWNVRDAQTLSYDVGWITGRRTNVFVANGQLTIRVLYEPGAKALSGAVAPSNRPWSTGYIDTIGKFSQKYGRWEMRAKLPTTENQSRGIWPAWWMRPDNPGLGDGEIDMMEAWGTPSAGSSVANNDIYRAGSAQWTLWQSEQTGAAKKSGWSTPGPNSPDLAAGFHVYAFEWTPSSMKVYTDGVLRGTVNSTDISWYASSFASPFHLRLQTEVGQNYWGLPDANSPNTVTPADFVIDYVRMWSYTP